jgi:hypothetical protein
MDSKSVITIRDVNLKLVRDPNQQQKMIQNKDMIEEDEED